MLSETKHLGLSYKKEILHCASLSLMDALRCVQNDIVSLSHALNGRINLYKLLASRTCADKIYIPVKINCINRG